VKNRVNGAATLPGSIRKAPIYQVFKNPFTIHKNFIRGKLTELPPIGPKPRRGSLRPRLRGIIPLSGKVHVWWAQASPSGSFLLQQVGPPQPPTLHP
jgi:hypothetical protein